MSFCVLEYTRAFSVISVQRAFKYRYGKEASINKSLCNGIINLGKQIACVERKAVAKGLERRPGEDGATPDIGRQAKGLLSANFGDNHDYPDIFPMPGLLGPPT
ncbi:hypothetical protein TNCV_1152781 [Trichonephila clavipes]|nr:hypothetical protein TNCV_1152781 [Trichonephila clavipes]